MMAIALVDLFFFLFRQTLTNWLNVITFFIRTDKQKNRGTDLICYTYGPGKINLC